VHLHLRLGLLVVLKEREGVRLMRFGLIRLRLEQRLLVVLLVLRLPVGERRQRQRQELVGEA
jgi:hypothetical protein